MFYLVNHNGIMKIDLTMEYKYQFMLNKVNIFDL